ncbi:MAG: AraC family transcriptional regulator ligand-binding domain-containing protein [Methyloceanibacter sp.]|jgi:AraC-like DNA-binding protein
MAADSPPNPNGNSLDSITCKHRVRALTLSGLRELLRSYGVELAPILREAELSAEYVGNDYAWIPLEKLAKVLTLAARDTRDACFGLKYGSVMRSTSNPLGYMMANAPDLRIALRSFACFHPVLSSNNLEFVESAGGGRIEWSFPVTVPDITQLTDFVLMRFISRIQSAAGRAWRPVSVGVMHRQPRDLAEYRRCLGPRMTFNQAVSSIAIAGSTLALPMPQADPQLFQLLSRFCQEELERQKDGDHPLNQIREAMIICLQQGSFGPKCVAKELGLAPASLHRRLKAENTSFQRLLDDTRRSLAERYLLESSLNLTDIASRVGYSELSAFSRAARRWFGTTPRSFRRRAPNLDAAA